MKKYTDIAVRKTLELLAIDSPTGFTYRAAEWVKNEFASLGFDSVFTTKGGVLVNLGGEGENGLLLEAHADTLGAMVAEIKGNGRLRVTPLGGMRAYRVMGTVIALRDEDAARVITSHGSRS